MASSRIRPTHVLLATLYLLTACGELAAPDLERATAVSGETARSEVDPDERNLADPYAGSWMSAGLAFDLTHDTTVVIAGRPVRFYSGEGSYAGEDVVVSAFDSEDDLALYVDRFVPPDVLEPALYGHATREGEHLSYDVAEPNPARFLLRRLHPQARVPSLRKTPIPFIARKARAETADPVTAASAPDDPPGGPEYAYVYGVWRFCMERIGGGASRERGRDRVVIGELALGYDTSSHLTTSTGINARVELSSVEVAGPAFVVEGVVHAQQGPLPLQLTGYTQGDAMSAELVLAGEAFALTAERGRLPAGCGSARG